MNYIIRLHTACGCVSDRDYVAQGTPPPVWNVALMRPVRANWQARVDDYDITDASLEPMKRVFDLYDIREGRNVAIAEYRERL
jgi:hypothetical protein